MPKDDWLHIRIDSDLKERIERYAKDNGYDDLATFVREILSETINPEKTDERIKEKIRVALRDDPSLLDDSLRRIGIRLYATKSNEK
jgi:predicted DNA-binding protein